jgi:hypothetical protein
MCGPVGPMMYAENASGVTSGEFSQKGRPIAVGRSFAILTGLFAFLNAAPPSVLLCLSFHLSDAKTCLTMSRHRGKLYVCV